jgi:hypothetical protein
MSTPGTWTWDVDHHEVIVGDNVIAEVWDPIDGPLLSAAKDLADACLAFTQAAHEVRSVLNSKGFACPASVALAAEKARHALEKTRAPPP